MSIIDTLKQILRFIRAAESVVIDLVAASTPWAAPLMPAYMVHQSMITRLEFPAWVAIAGAVVVECLGLSAISTAVSFWDYNDTKTKSSPRAPLFVSVVTAVFYLVIVLTVNVMLDSAGSTEKVAKAMLSSMSVIGGMIIAIRAQHARRLESIHDEKLEKRLERQLKSARVEQDKSQSLDWRSLPLEDKQLIGGMTVKQISTRYSVSERTALNWLKHTR